MPDDIDAAQEREQQERDAAIRRARLCAGDGQFPSGRVDCHDCHDPIPPERLATLPGAIRCVRCQTLRDRGAVPVR